MFKSIFIKYTTAFMLINIVCMFVLTSATSSLVNSYSKDVKETTLEKGTTYISEYMYAGMEDFNMYNMDSYVGIMAERLRSFLGLMNVHADEYIMFLVNKYGEIVVSGGSEGANKYHYDFTEGPQHVRYFIPKDNLDKLKTAEYVTEESTLGGVLEERSIIYSVPLFDPDGEFIGAIVGSSPSSGMNALLNGMIKTITMSTLWIILAMLVSAYFISVRLVSPIRAMSRAAKKFGQGQFDVRVPVRGRDEVAELATAFNNMAASLESNEEMRRLFLANVSHDLRTPMTTISGFIDGILDGAIPPEKHEYYLGVIASEVRRLSRLVSTLLDITRIQAGERKFNMVNFDICEMCRQVLISSEQRIESKKLDVEFNADSDNIFAVGDTDSIHQIVYNLMDNAIKFSYEGGRYVISISEGSGKVTVSVFNEGNGISESDLPYVFDRFYKSDRSRGLDKTGVGLGLYICRTIIEAHGQTIKVESEFGKWCKFTFTLQKGSAAKALADKQQSQM